MLSKVILGFPVGRQTAKVGIGYEGTGKKGGSCGETATYYGSKALGQRSLTRHLMGRRIDFDPGTQELSDSVPCETFDI